MTDRIRVVVVDDHQLFRAGVRAELASHYEIVGEASAPAEAIAVIGAASPDVVLLDVHLPDGGGVAVLRALAGTPDPPRVLALSVSDAAEDVVPMIRAGALGYVTKTIDTDALVEALPGSRPATRTSARGWLPSFSRPSAQPSRSPRRRRTIRSRR